MKTFHCQHCYQAVHFENVECLRCKSQLAFIPDRLGVAAIEAADAAGGLFRLKGRGSSTPQSAARYRLCHNHSTYQACNFAVPADDPNPLCVSCRLTRILPDLSQPDNRERWYAIEVAKRRLFYTLAKLGLLSPTPPGGEADGPVFEFLEDQPGQPVLTGHCNGLITINVAEADDAERVKRRVALHEPYRTLLGHFRHESGHYYWDRLVRDEGRVKAFRAVFGDESQNYSDALQRHYEAGGGPPGWQDRCVSAYATSHPWEDWAETWAHYFHMVDLLETAASYHTRLSVPGGDAPRDDEVSNPFENQAVDFDELVEQWVPLTLLLNSLNRSLGQGDAYPFALSPGALAKLRFVHEVIHAPRQPVRTQAHGASQPVDPAPAPSAEHAQLERSGST